MAIIDNKGMLFGKINIIDFLVILFSACAIIIFYFGYRAINKKQPRLSPAGYVRDNLGRERFITLNNVNVLFVKLDDELLKLISVGDKEKDRNGQIIGEISSLGKPETITNIIDIGVTDKISVDDPLLKRLPAVLRIKAEIREDGLYYKDKKITFNSNITFQTDIYRIEALYVSIEEQSGISWIKYEKSALAGTLESRINILEKKVNNNLEKKVNNLEKKVNNLEKKVNNLEIKPRKRKKMIFF